MRFLHTADWHIGKTLFGRSRQSEQEAVTAEIIDIARREQVDCVILAGDIFETRAPSGDAERVVNDALAEFAGSRIATVVVGGNHDDPRRLAALRNIGRPMDIFVVAEPCRPEAGGVIRLKRKGEMAMIAVLPWVAEHRVVDICQMMQPEDEWYAAYSTNVAGMCRLLTRDFSEDTVNILTAHLFAFGAETSGSEKPVHIAQPFAIQPGLLPAAAQYIALGHIHKPQEVGSSSRCFYAGSPLQLDFGEREQQKRVVIVDVKAGLPANIESISLTAGRRLREVNTTLERLPGLVEACGNDYLRVIVQSETRVAGLAQQVSDLLPNALEIRPDLRSVPAAPPRLDVKAAKPVDLFAQFVLGARGQAASAEMLAKFEELYKEVNDAAG